ncbi:MAG TPA: hypothetical protein VF006_23255 [Longimicrobium sp.]
MMRFRGVLLAAVLAAACGSEPEAGAVRASSPDSASGVAAGAAGDTADAAAPVAAAAEPAAGGVVLAADGVEVGGAAGRLAFGSGREQVLAAVGAVLGTPTEQGTNEECPAGPLSHVQYAGLQLVFQDGGFVGWFAQEGSPLRTARGIGPGSTLGQVKAAHPAATVEETSLGSEFAADGLYGIVTSPSNEGKVQVMFAGTNCIFR